MKILAREKGSRFDTLAPLELLLPLMLRRNAAGGRCRFRGGTERGQGVLGFRFAALRRESGDFRPQAVHERRQAADLHTY
jgi:hypothetical protein